MTDSAFDQKLDALASFPRLDAGAVRRFGEAVRALDPIRALRINPYAFGAEHGFGDEDVLDLFVHGAKVGLFDFAWSLMCDSCGAYVVNHGDMSALEPIGHCALCDVDVEANLDDQVEVAFALNPSVGRIEHDPYADAASYWEFAFSKNFRKSPRVEALMREATLELALVRPDTTVRFEVEVEPGRTLGLVSVERNIAAWLEPAVSGMPSASERSFDVVETGIFPATASVASGRLVLTVRNRTKAPIGIGLFLDDDRIEPALEAEPSTIDRFLTGKQLLNCQSFRDLFRVQHLVPGLNLPLRSLTILFTDLKGSTDLYDRTGDVYAYGLVRSHYDELTEAVRMNAGAVIKTMGDAIMASFSHPLDAVRAAVDMVRRIDKLNETWRRDGNVLGLKVGLHEGPALAVNADERLDYFGQTVNIAARVQALAAAGEIWHTDRVLEAPGVAELFVEHGYATEPHSVALKGVGEPVRVHRWRVAAASEPASGG